MAPVVVVVLVLVALLVAVVVVVAVLMAVLVGVTVHGVMVMRSVGLGMRMSMPVPMPDPRTVGQDMLVLDAIAFQARFALAAATAGNAHHSTSIALMFNSSPVRRRQRVAPQ
jgi:hypothetical protein